MQDLYHQQGCIMLSIPASLGSRDLAFWLWGLRLGGQELSAASFEMLGVSRITGLGLRKGLVPPCALLVLMFAKKTPEAWQTRPWRAEADAGQGTGKSQACFLKNHYTILCYAILYCTILYYRIMLGCWFRV